jgi:hypothetical protein
MHRQMFLVLIVCSSWWENDEALYLCIDTCFDVDCVCFVVGE